MRNLDAQSTPVTRLDLCGQVTLQLAGEDIPRPIPGGRATLLLAYLAVNPRPVHRDELVDLLWRHGGPADPQAGLSTLLSRLRQAIGQETLTGRTSVRLQFAAPICTDVERARRAVEDARVAFDASDWGRVQSCCGAALDLLDAGFLLGFEDPWIDRQRGQLEALAVEALELQGRAGLAAGSGGYAAAATAAGRVVELAPYREAGYEVLMRTLIADGNDAAALQVYDRLRTLLRDDLGTAPAAALRQLHATALVPGELDPPATPAPRTTTPSVFVGRREELEVLDDLITRPRGRLIAVRGEPGIGKTRLTAEAAARATADGALVLWGRCDEETLVPYQPIVEALREHVASCPADQLRRQVGDGGPDLALLLPALRRRLPGLAATDAAESELERFRLFDHVARFVVQIAAGTRLVLVLDDLQWADAPSLLLLRHLLRTSAEAPGLVVVATYRDTETSDALSGLLAQLDRDGLVDAVPLDGLSTQEVSAWMAEAFASLSSEALAARLRRHTGGNPLFVGELLRELTEAGPDVDWSGGPQLDVPVGIRQVIGGRVDRVGPGARRLLTAAAVVGEQVTFDVLRLLGQGSDEELVDALDAAVMAGLLLEERAFGTYRFAHALIRETLLQECTETRRVLLHQQVGEALETLDDGGGDVRLAELAHHFSMAAPGGGHVRAVDYGERAGRRAAGMLAWEEAARHYDRALEVIGLAGLGPRRRCELLIARGEAERGSGNAVFRDTLLEAAAVAEGIGDPALMARAALANNRGFFSSTFGVDEERVGTIRAALRAQDGEDGETRARLLAQLAVELVPGPGWEDRVACSDEAVAIARRLGDPDTLALVLSQRFITLWGPRTLPERRAIAAEGAALAPRVTDRALIHQSLLAGTHAALEAGELAEADDYLKRVRTLERVLRQRTLSWFGATARAKRALLTESPDDAERAAMDAFALGTSSEQADAPAWLGSQLWVVRFHQGRLHELPLPAPGAVPTTLTRLLEAMTVATLAETERLDEARTALDELLAGYADGVPHDWAALAIPALAASACGHLGDARCAAVLRPHLEPWAEQFVNFGPSWMGSTSYYLGILERALGHHDGAAARFAAAAEAHRRIGARPWLARTQLEWAQTLLGRDGAGDRARAAELLAPAVATARELGLATVTRRGGELLGRAGA